MNITNHVSVISHRIGVPFTTMWVNYLQQATQLGKCCLVVLHSKEEIALLLHELSDLKVQSELSAQKDKHKHMYEALLQGYHYLITGKFFNLVSYTADMQMYYQTIGENGVELVLSDQVNSIYNTGKDDYVVDGYTLRFVAAVAGTKVIARDDGKVQPCRGIMYYPHLLAQEGRLHLCKSQAYGVLNHPRFQYFHRVVVLGHEFHNTIMRMVFDLCQIPYTVQEAECDLSLDWRKLSITGIKTYYSYDPHQGENFSRWELTAIEKRTCMKVFRHIMKTFIRNVARTGKENFVWTSPHSYWTALRTSALQNRFVSHPYNQLMPNVTALAYMRDIATYMVGFDLFCSQGVAFDSMEMTLRDFKLFAATTALSEGKRVYAYIPNAEVRQAVQNFVSTEKNKARAAYDKQRKHEWYVKNLKPKREAAKRSAIST